MLPSGHSGLTVGFDQTNRHKRYPEPGLSRAKDLARILANVCVATKCVPTNCAVHFTSPIATLLSLLRRLAGFCLSTQGSRPGLHSYAAARLVEAKTHLRIGSLLNLARDSFPHCATSVNWAKMFLD